MRLGNRAFEWSVRRHVGRAVRESPELRREYRRLGAWWNRLSLWTTTGWALLVIPFVSAMPLFLLSRFVAQVAGGDKVLLISVMLVVTLSVLHEFMHLISHFAGAADLRVLAYMPVSDELLFRQVWRSFIRSTLFELGTITFLYTAGGLARFGPLAWWLGIAGLSVLHWLTIPALATVFLAYCPSGAFWSTLRIVQPSQGLLLISLIAMPFVGRSIAPHLAPVADTILLAVPTGWTAFVYGRWLDGGSIDAGIVLVAALGLLVPLPFAYRRLKDRYHIREFVVESDGGFAAVVEGFEREPMPSDVESVSEGTTSQVDADEAFLNDWSDPGKAFDRPPAEFEVEPWRETEVAERRPGAIERIVRRWLSPRERLIFECLAPRDDLQGSEWTLQWRRWTLFCLIACAACAVIPSALFSYIGILVPVFLVSLASRFTDTAAYESYYNYLYYFDKSAFPVRYREVSRTILKTWAVSFLGWLLLPALVLGGVLAWKFAAPVLVGVLYALKFLSLIVAALPWLVVLMFSAGTTHPFAVRTGLYFLTTIAPAAVVFLGGGFLWFVAETLPLAALGALALAVSSLGGWYAYGRWYERGIMDVNRQVR
jgi:hypothetical protein